MIQLLLENEADCLIRQHTEPRHGPLKCPCIGPEPLPRERFSPSTHCRRSTLETATAGFATKADVQTLRFTEYHMNRFASMAAVPRNYLIDEAQFMTTCREER
jgi:hypothetical protein